MADGIKVYLEQRARLVVNRSRAMRWKQIFDSACENSPFTPVLRQSEIHCTYECGECDWWPELASRPFRELIPALFFGTNSRESLYGYLESQGPGRPLLSETHYIVFVRVDSAPLLPRATAGASLDHAVYCSNACSTFLSSDFTAERHVSGSAFETLPAVVSDFSRTSGVNYSHFSHKITS